MSVLTCGCDIERNLVCALCYIYVTAYEKSRSATDKITIYQHLADNGLPLETIPTLYRHRISPMEAKTVYIDLLDKIHKQSPLETEDIAKIDHLIKLGFVESAADTHHLTARGKMVRMVYAELNENHREILMRLASARADLISYPYEASTITNQLLAWGFIERRGSFMTVTSKGAEAWSVASDFYSIVKTQSHRKDAYVNKSAHAPIAIVSKDAVQEELVEADSADTPKPPLPQQCTCPNCQHKRTLDDLCKRIPALKRYMQNQLLHDKSQLALSRQIEKALSEMEKSPA